MYKIPNRFGSLLFGFLLSGFMTFLISGIALLRVLGPAAALTDFGGFGSAWLSAYLSSWPVAFPVVLVVAPLVRRLVGWLTVN